MQTHDASSRIAERARTRARFAFGAKWDDNRMGARERARTHAHMWLCVCVCWDISSLRPRRSPHKTHYILFEMGNKWSCSDGRVFGQYQHTMVQRQRRNADQRASAWETLDPFHAVVYNANMLCGSFLLLNSTAICKNNMIVGHFITQNIPFF